MPEDADLRVSRQEGDQILRFDSSGGFIDAAAPATGVEREP